MEFCVLGPLEVLDENGTSIRVPGRIHPRILATLLLEPGHAVSTAYLTEVVWDGDAPATAADQLRNAVPVLRKVVGDRLRNARGQLSLRVEDGELDLRRFERAVARARDLRYDGRAREALRELRTGLELWRGRVLPGLRGRYFEQAATRLAAARLGAVEDRIDVELELGESDGAVAQLRQLLVAHPHRQRLVGQLMLALYRAGDAAEALDVYRELSDRLAEDLGTDPGSALRDLHVAILREDPKLLAARPETTLRTATPSVGVPVPAQLPVDTTGFVGRREELDTLDTLVDRGAGTVVVSAIDGTGGAGKTALAVHWAHRHRDAFPDGQLYVNLRGFDRDKPLAPQDALERFLNALGLKGTAIPSDTEAAAALFRSMLADRRMLVLLDNARDVEQVRPLLPGSGESLTIVTSRHSLAALTALYNMKAIPLGILEPDEALRLLADVVGTDRLQAEPDAARRLAQLCAGLPLALRIAAANLSVRQGVSVAEFVAELESGDRLEQLAVDGAPEIAVTATLDHSFDTLAADEQRLFLLLGLVPGEDFRVELVAAVAQLPPQRAQDLLDRLESAHLLERHRPGRYRLHDLVRLYAHSRAATTLADTEPDGVTDRFIGWHGDREPYLDSEEDDNVLAACETLGRHPKLWRLADALNEVDRGGGTIERAQRVFERALSIAEAETDHEGCYRMLVRLVPCHRFRGDTDRGLEAGRRAVEFAERLDRRSVSVAKANLGLMYYSATRYREAEPMLREAYAIASATDNVRHQQINALNLGMLYRESGRYAEADEYLTLAEAASTRLPFYPTVILIGVDRADLLRSTGAYAAAAARLDGLPVPPDGEISARIACLTLRSRAELATGTGDLAAARDFFERMRATAVENDLAYLNAESTWKLAIVDAGLGEAARALRLLDVHTASSIEGLGPHLVAGFALARAEVHNAAARPEAALREASRAVELFAAMPNPLLHAKSLLALADACTGLNRADEAARHRAEALAIHARIGAPWAARSAVQREQP